MNIDAIVRFVLMIGIPAFMMWRCYKKMSEEEQNDVKTDFTSKRFISTIGLMALGWVFFLLEPIFEMTWMETIGVVLLSIVIMVSIVLTWLNAPSKRKAVLKTIPLLIAFSILLWVNY
ncbi:hypothetical protein J7J00_15270 [Bacillus sp. ISL-4]|uniref:hypothetical protein n=1 Tax=Bacillus sp. ISL-4 TaxID=2819125 RepID=UPI001BED246A|nr:hypothetical protein [Bacillus sp. ISL-4]MBT2666859.1 hypothetical protein [Bacillus sp. ISL-4]MBT2671724.1 hypothetical protein [Streptomyces sp. ISL-14]